MGNENRIETSLIYKSKKKKNGGKNRKNTKTQKGKKPEKTENFKKYRNEIRQDIHETRFPRDFGKC